MSSAPHTSGIFGLCRFRSPSPPTSRGSRTARPRFCQFCRVPLSLMIGRDAVCNATGKDSHPAVITSSARSTAPAAAP